VRRALTPPIASSRVTDYSISPSSTLRSLSSVSPSSFPLLLHSLHFPTSFVMSDDESIVSSSKVTILNPSNYHVWAPEAEHRLMTLGLLRFVEDGKAERPAPLPAGTTTDDGRGVKTGLLSSSLSSSLTWETLEKRRRVQEAWEEKDEKARATLLTSIRKDLRSIATKGMTARELWDALEVKYGKQSLTDSEFTFDSMISKRYQDGESMTAHVNFLRNSNLQLTKTDFHQTDKLMMYYLLKSLPSTWEPVRMTLRTSSAAGAALDFDRMASMLQEQASQMKRDLSMTSDPVVFAHSQSATANWKQQSGRGKSEQPTHICSHHGKNWTHVTAECRALQTAAGKQPTKPSTGNKPVAALITYPFGPESDEEKDEEGQCVLSEDEIGQEATQLTESTLPTLPASTNSGTPSTAGSTYPVIADTGASCHLWKEDVSTLFNYTAIENRYVVTGSGQRHRIEGMGTLRGHTPTGDFRVHAELSRVCHVPTLAYNLISLGCLDDDGYKSIQFRGTSTTTDQQGRTVLVAKKTGTGHVYQTSFTVKPLSLIYDTLPTAGGRGGGIQASDCTSSTSSGRLISIISPITPSAEIPSLPEAERKDEEMGEKPSSSGGFDGSSTLEPTYIATQHYSANALSRRRARDRHRILALSLSATRA
jgi:hypothetical protein